MGTQSGSTNHFYRNYANQKMHIVPLFVIIFIDKLIKVSKYCSFSFEIIHHIDNVNQFNILHIALFLSIQEYGMQNSTKVFFHFLMNMFKRQTCHLVSCMLRKKTLTRDKTYFKSQYLHQESSEWFCKLFSFEIDSLGKIICCYRLIQ